MTSTPPVTRPEDAGASDRTLRVGLVSISDRASSGQYQDQGIPSLQQWLQQAITTPCEFETRLIADCGHSPHLQAPDETRAAIARFIAPFVG